MAVFDKDGDERNLPATAERREEFRKQGSVAMSREVLSVVVLFGAGAALYLGAQWMSNEFGALSRKFFSLQSAATLGFKEIVELRYSVGKTWGLMLLPIVGVSLASALIAAISQVGVFVTWEPLSPKWERVNPINGFQRIFSSDGGVEAIKAFLKMFLAVFVSYFFLKDRLPSLGHLLGNEVAVSTVVSLQLVAGLFFTLLFSFSGISALDYLWQKWKLEKEMKMTRREAKDELKLREGDPAIKARVRSIQRRIANRRMMDSVPKADVVITNPTHLAVALMFDKETMIAPKVVAKGAGVIAVKIKELARFNHVPIVENKPLARTLYKMLDIGETIPRELYKAVAEVIAYVYRLSGKSMRTAQA